MKADNSKAIILNDKQEAFGKEVVLNGGNKVEAFKKAGWKWENYSPNALGVQADKQFNHPKISLRIKQLQETKVEAVKESLKLDSEWVLSKLQKVVNRCMQEEEVMSKDGPTGEFKFDSSGANKAIELIGKHLKMFTDKVEQDTTLTVVRKSFVVESGKNSK